MPGSNIAKKWRDLSGEKDWKGLLKPLDNDLRTYLLHYGDMESATYASFVSGSMSQFAGGSAAPKGDILRMTGTMKRDPLMKYKVTKYFYGTSQIDVPGLSSKSKAPNPAYKESTWLGYIAVATDEGKKLLGRRDIVVAFRGTLTPMEWYKDMEGNKVPAKEIFNTKLNPLLQQGFYSVYTSHNPMSRSAKTSARDQVGSEVKKLIGQFKHEEHSVTIIGHSLGAALATICAADFAAHGIAATAFPFASPLVGDHTWKTFVDGLDKKNKLKILRIANQQDVVTKVPPPMLGYVHVGQVLQLNSGASSYLQNPPNIAGPHDMEVYLHCIAGAKGGKRIMETSEETEADHGDDGFDLKGRRDFSLVNKFTNMLKPEFRIPDNWWVLENKGMVKQKNGKFVMTAGNWILRERRVEHGTSGGVSDDDDNEAED